MIEIYASRGDLGYSYMLEITLILVSLLLVVVCGLFVAAEFSLITVNKNALEKLALKGDKKAQGALKAISSLSTQLSSAQVGITITNLGIGFLAEPAISRVIQKPLLAAGVSEGIVPGVSITLGILLATVVTMVFGELIPKNLAISRPLLTARLIERPLLFFTGAMAPIIRLLNNSANAILRQLRIEPQEELASARSADELLSLVRRSAEKGTLAKETAQLLEKSLTFGDLTVRDTMIPRVNVDVIDENESVAAGMELARKTGHSRFPVYRNEIDTITGVLHIKDAFTVPAAKRATTKIRSIIRKPVFVPSTVELESLLHTFRESNTRIAIAIDEFGGMDGVVTIEDLFEEFVGEVRDEYDIKSRAVHRKNGTTWTVSGLMRPDEVAAHTGVYLPEQVEVETLGGIVAQLLRRIPAVNDTVSIRGIDRAGEPVYASMTVLRMDGNRIDKLRLTVRQSLPKTKHEEKN